MKINVNDSGKLRQVEFYLYGNVIFSSFKHLNNN